MAYARAVIQTYAGDVTEAALCLKSFRLFAARAWREIDPAPFIASWHVDAICDHLQALYEGSIQRLIINIPPGAAKSMLCGVLWPAWVWAKNPSWQLLSASYEVQLATRDAVKARNLMRSDWYSRHFRTEGEFVSESWDFSDDQDLKQFYRNTRFGLRQALGVGGKGTGYRGHCLSGSAMIETEQGLMRMDTLCAMASPPRVWSLNHESGKPELVRVLATSKRYALTRDICTVTGARVSCTNEHPIYSDGAYRRSENLRPGDSLIACSRALVPSVPDCFPSAGVRTAEEAGGGAHEFLLSSVRNGFHKRTTREDGLALQHMPDASAQSRSPSAPGKGVLFSVSPHTRQQNGDSSVSRVPQVVQPDKLPTPVLFSAVCQQDAQPFDAGSGELSFQNRNELRGVVSSDATIDHGARRMAVRQLQGAGANIGCAVARPDNQAQQSDYSPRGREAGQQPSDQSRDVVRPMPHSTPQIQNDEVALVGRLGRTYEPVYDIQVERNSNFFANSILVHNSLLIDDPISAADAHSKIARDTCIRWKDETMSSRFNNLEKATELLIMQRLHEEDLTGHLLRQGDWEHLNLPAEFEVKRRCATRLWGGWSDPRTFEGESMCDALFPKHVLTRQKRKLGSYGYAGQYQQRPAPAEGGILKRDWFNRRWVLPGELAPEGMECKALPARFDLLSLWTDAAFKDTSHSDFVAIGVVGTKGPNCYLLQLKWERMSFTATMAALVDLKNKWGPRGLSGIYIEDKANGTAIMNALKGKIPGLIPVEPEGGKEARIQAAAPFIESGNLWLPLHAPWVDDYITEATSFPKAPHDDAIDMTAYFLSHYCGKGFNHILEALSRDD